jgi:carboxylesterase type B
MRFIKYLSIAVVGAVFSPVFAQSAPTVILKNGTYGGIHDLAFNHDIFLGIPYAQPPVGNLRLRVPEPVNETWTETRQAVAYGKSCPA